MAEQTQKPQLSLDEKIIEGVDQELVKNAKEAAKTRLEGGEDPSTVKMAIIKTLVDANQKRKQQDDVQEQARKEVLSRLTELSNQKVPTGMTAGTFSAPLRKLLGRETGIKAGEPILQPRGIDDAEAQFRLELQRESQLRGRPKQAAETTLAEAKVEDIPRERKLKILDSLIKEQGLEKGKLDITKLRRELKSKTPGGISDKKSAEKAAEDKVTALQQITDMEEFVKGFEDMEEEIINKVGKDALKTGITGITNRFIAAGAEKLDMLPKTSSFIKNLKVKANKMARTIEGGRVTDQDRAVYAASLADALSNPSEENTSLLATALYNIKVKGGDIANQLKVFNGSKSKTLNRVSGILQSYADRNNDNKTIFSSVKDAENANLPVGTEITINGRRAVIE